MSGTMFLGATPGSPNAGKDRRDGALVIRSARQWLAENKAAPFFAFVHLFDMHKPYNDGYDGRLAYVDRLIGVFKQSLEQMGLWDKALVILVSDHGESLGDHGESSHGYFIYESTLHVPLIVHWPVGSEGHAERVADPVGLIDVAPTVLDFLHFAGACFCLRGPVYWARTVRFMERVCMLTMRLGWAALGGVCVVGPFKYILTRRGRSFIICRAIRMS